MNNLSFFAWKEMMAFGLGTLRLSPQQFWAMTPRELYSALEGVFGPPASLSPPARRDLFSLMQRYPDQDKPK